MTAQFIVINPPRVTVEFIKEGGGYTGPAVRDGDRLLFPARLKSVRGCTQCLVDGEVTAIARIGQCATQSALVEAFIA